MSTGQLSNANSSRGGVSLNSEGVSIPYHQTQMGSVTLLLGLGTTGLRSETLTTFAEIYNDICHVVSVGSAASNAPQKPMFRPSYVLVLRSFYQPTTLL